MKWQSSRRGTETEVRIRSFLARRQWIAQGILLVASVAVSLVLGEGLVRYVAPQSLILERPDIWIPDADVGWRHRSNVDTHVNTGEREVRWRTDDEGFRIGTSPAAAADMTVVALGDSFLEAMQVENEETMISFLENRLRPCSGRSLRILNAGVAGWDPNQYRIELRRVVRTRSVEGVLVFVYLGNDIVGTRVERYAPRQPVRRHLLRIPKKLQWTELVEAIGYPVNDFLESRSHLFILLRNQFKYALMRAGLTAFYFPDSLLLSQASSNRWRTTAGLLKEVEVVAKEHGLPTLFVLIPSRQEADLREAERTADAFGIVAGTFDVDQGRRLLGTEMKRRRLVVVDTTSALRTAIAENTPDVYGRVDTHLGKRGHQLVAEAMRESVWQMLCGSKK